MDGEQECGEGVLVWGWRRGVAGGGGFAKAEGACGKRPGGRSMVCIGVDAVVFDGWGQWGVVLGH
jgi:hypothetical protein